MVSNEVKRKIDVRLEQCSNCVNCLKRNPKCRIRRKLGYYVFYGKNGECTFFRKKD